MNTQHPAISFQNAISCDQVAAKMHGDSYRYPSLVLSSPSSSGTGGGGWGPGHSLSWNERGDAIPAMSSPLDLYHALFGGGAINAFAFTLLAGVLTGTFSSIFIAGSLVLWKNKGEKPKLADETVITKHSISTSEA